MGLELFSLLKSITNAGRKPSAAEAWCLEMPNTTIYARRRQAVLRELKNRLNNPGFDRLAELYGVELPAHNLFRRLDALHKLAAEHWDFRKGKMRYEVDFTTVAPGESVLDLNNPKIQRVIEEAAGSFGLTSPSQVSRDEYDGLIVPGGAELSPLLRLKYALEQVGPSGRPVKYGWIALLGCDRPVGKDELAKVKFYAPKAKTEFDLLVAAAESLLDLELVRDANMRRVGYAYDHETQPHVRYYRDVNDTLVLVFNAPIPANDFKANTGHTYDFLRAVSGPRLSRGKHILLSSTARHRAFQHVDAERLLSLPTGISLETIGFSKAYTVDGLMHDNPTVQTPKELLQEIKAYVDALVKLKNATNWHARAQKAASKA